MSTTLEYRCPNCDGALSFSSDSQNLTCPYCDSELDPAGVQEYNEAVNCGKEESPQWETYDENSGNGGWKVEESANLVVHRCQSCSGEIVTNKNTAVTRCHYCDNNIFIPKQFSDELKPDFVIPFKWNQEQAKEALRDFYKGKPLLNPCFKDENHLDEITGIYVPFWLYDCETTSEIHYKTTKVRRYSDRNYNYVETKYFSVFRGGNARFSKIPADGSSKMNDTYMESIEPFYYKDLVPFNPSYFAGFVADKYDISADSLKKRVNDRIRNSVISAFTPLNYDSVTTVNAQVEGKNQKVHYVLLPVWVLNTRFQGDLHTFMMNGQTGKLVGSLPVDKKRAFLMFLGIFSGIFFASCGIVGLLLS